MCTNSKAQKRLRHIAVLIDDIHKMIQLIAELEIVRAPPAALEKREVLVELVMLIRVKERVGAVVRRRRSLRRLLEICRQSVLRSVVRHAWVATICGLRAAALRGVLALSHAASAPHKVRCRRGPAEVVIVVEEV